MKFYKGELGKIGLASFVLALAFSILLSKGIPSPKQFVIYFMIIAPSFIFHELAHKLFAQKRRKVAYFEVYLPGLILALVTSFFGFIFAAPGAVMIRGRVKKQELLEIAASGPIVNILFSLASIPFLADPVLALFFRINAILALFNLLPVPPLDGYKVFSVNKLLWVALFVIALMLQ